MLYKMRLVKLKVQNDMIGSIFKILNTTNQNKGFWLGYTRLNFVEWLLRDSVAGADLSFPLETTTTTWREQEEELYYYFLQACCS